MFLLATFIIWTWQNLCLAKLQHDGRSSNWHPGNENRLFTHFVNFPLTVVADEMELFIARIIPPWSIPKLDAVLFCEVIGFTSVPTPELGLSFVVVRRILRPPPAVDVIVQPYPRLALTIAQIMRQHGHILLTGYGGQIFVMLPAVGPGVSPVLFIFNNVVLTRKT